MLSIRELWRKLFPQIPVPHEDGRGIATAKQAREMSERQRAQAMNKSPEVSEVSRTMRNYRLENNFSEKFHKAMRGR